MFCPSSCLVDSHIQELKDHGISARSLTDQGILLSSEASCYDIFSAEKEPTLKADTKKAKGVKNHRANFRTTHVVAWKEKRR